MDKLEPTFDKRCGTYAGYKAHRDRNEQLCQPCRDAMNAYRREKWNSDPKYKEHSKTYKKRHPDRVKAQASKYRLDPEIKAAKKAERAKATAKRLEAKKLEKAAIREAKLKKSKEETLLRREAKKAARAGQLAEAKAKREAKQAELNKAREKRKSESKSAKEAIRRAENKVKREKKQQERELAKQARKAKKALLANQHGTSTGDYTRCKKLNGVACEPCRAAAAKYVRDKWHSDPKYKAREKEWYKNNPDKRHNNKNKNRLKGGKHRPYTRNQIFKRDGYDCYLCHTPVDLTAPTHQPIPGWELYPHIEHVHPLSKGGDDTLENVKIAHAECNIRKGAKIYQATT
jgi:hypothetical protein